jgi:hypothetical protein
MLVLGRAAAAAAAAACTRRRPAAAALRVAAPPPPAATPRLARGYYSRPVPRLTLATVATRYLAPRHADRGRVAPGTPLTEFERMAVGDARRRGFLWSRHNCGQAAADAHFTFCCHTRTPYIAAVRDGSSLIVDARPVGGLAKLKRDGAVDGVLAAFQAALAQERGAGAGAGLQVVNDDSAAAQREAAGAGAAAPGGGGGGDGPNTGRAPDAALGDSFTLHVAGGRRAGLALAGRLAELARTALGLPSGAERAAATAARVARRTARRQAVLVRALERLVADPLRVKGLRVKAGAVDGFVRAQAAGTHRVVPSK